MGGLHRGTIYEEKVFPLEGKSRRVVSFGAVKLSECLRDRPTGQQEDTGRCYQ